MVNVALDLCLAVYHPEEVYLSPYAQRAAHSAGFIIHSSLAIEVLITITVR